MVEDDFNELLLDFSVEELLEHFDIDPAEALEQLFYSGMINEELVFELLKK